jgi:hypothetical protein
LVVLCALKSYAVEPRDASPALLFPTTNYVDYMVDESPGSSGDPNILDNRLRGNFIVSKSSSSTWAVQQNVSEFQLSHAPVIAQTGLSIPQSLWDVQTGGSYLHNIGDRRGWGISGSAGSASDELFQSIHETVFRATGMYHLPSGQENAWLFMLSYSNNRYFANNIPLP